MNQKDIIVGEEYVYQRSKRYVPSKVKVLQKNIAKYSYRSGEMRSALVLIETSKGDEFKVPARRITKLWSEHEQDKQTVKDLREQKAKEEEKKIFEVMDMLIYKGFEDLNPAHQDRGFFIKGHNLGWTSQGVILSWDLINETIERVKLEREQNEMV